MRIFVFGIALSAATLMASSSFAAWAVCATGYKADPKMINGSEEYGQSYTCTGAKVAPKPVCSDEFTAQSTSGMESGGGTSGGMTMKDEKTVYTCAQPASK